MIQGICIISRPDLLPTVHGAAVKIMHTARSLSRAGVRVFVVTNDRLWFYEAKDGIVSRRPYPQVLLSLTNCPPAIKGKLTRIGMPSYWQGLEKVLRRVGYPRDEHFLYQALIDPDFWIRVLYVGRAFRIDVYQAEFPGYAVPALLASRLLGGQSSLVEHNVEYGRLRDTTELPPEVVARLRRIEIWCARNVDHVIVVSAVDRDRLEQDGVPSAKLRVIPHGVELEMYRGVSGRGIRQRYRIPEEVPLLVFHGTLHYWPNTCAVKHIAETVLPRLHALGVPAKALICGMNPPRYYAHPDIVFTGVVQDLPEHLAAADIAVVPLDDGGGTRLKILEYFAAGLPVVSTSKGAEGIPALPGIEIEIVEGIQGFAERVAALWHDRERARALGKAGQKFVQAYDWDAVCRQYLVAYEEGRSFPPLWRRSSSGQPGPADRTEARIPEGKLAGRTEAGCPAGRVTIHEGVAGSICRHIPVALKPVKPLTMIMSIVRGCNLRCRFCTLYEAPMRMPTGLALRLLDEAAGLGVRNVVFTGGEPFLHPDLWEIVTRARAKGMGTNVTTNGTLIEKQLERILQSGIDSVSVSIDGLRATHDGLRRVPGSHDASWKGLSLLREKGVPAQIYFVATKENVEELLPVYHAAREYGFGFDFWPVNDAEGLYIKEEASRRHYLDALETLSAADADIAARQSYYRTGLEYHAGWNRCVRCLGLIEHFGVDPEGWLLPCCVWERRELRVGNLHSDSLARLWYGEKAQALRKEIFFRGCRNRCFNHSLYEFEQSTGLSFLVGERPEKRGQESMLRPDWGEDSP